jgi:predicted nucleic acid-binding protein
MRRRKPTEEFLASLEFYPVTREIAKYAGALSREWRQKGVTLALPDLTVSAVAITNGIATRDG